jgi:hypothetical protein
MSGLISSLITRRTLDYGFARATGATLTSFTPGHLNFRSHVRPPSLASFSSFPLLGYHFVAQRYNPYLMTFDQHACDPSDNPYMPLALQGAVLNLDPDDLDFAYPLPGSFPHGAGLVDGGIPIMSATGLIHDDGDSHLDDNDDNSSEALITIEDHEFPSYFVEHGSPKRLFHSHGTYLLPVDGNEMKVCVTSSWGTCLCRHSTSSQTM